MKLTKFKKWAEAKSYVVNNIDQEQFPDREREGLEGPFRLRNGLVVYYDKIEGKYYNPLTDMFVYAAEYENANK